MKKFISAHMAQQGVCHRRSQLDLITVLSVVSTKRSNADSRAEKRSYLIFCELIWIILCITGSSLSSETIGKLTSFRKWIDLKTFLQLPFLPPKRAINLPNYPRDWLPIILVRRICAMGPPCSVIPANIQIFRGSSGISFNNARNWRNLFETANRKWQKVLWTVDHSMDLVYNISDKRCLRCTCGVHITWVSEVKKQWSACKQWLMETKVFWISTLKIKTLDQSEKFQTHGSYLPFWNI